MMRDYDYDSDASYEVSSPGQGSRFARGLRRIGHVLAAIPVIGSFVGLYAPIATAIAGLMESGESLIKGQYSRSFKQLVSGTVDTVATAVVAPVFWLMNPLIGIVSGDTIPEHLRKMTNWSLDSVGSMFAANESQTDYARQIQALGSAPRARGYAMAGMGWAPHAGLMQEQAAATGFVSYNGQAQAPRNYFTDRIAMERGVDPEQLRNNWMRDADNRKHFQQLVDASRAGPSLTGRA